ncbi:MAG: FABP domain-containing protein [Oscillospiraceae bacterium]|jgi:hypothetical protein
MNYEAAAAMEQEFEPERAQVKKWSAFVESDVVNFFNAHNIEKMTIDDGNGNKAKLSRTKDGGIKIDSTSSVIL